MPWAAGAQVGRRKDLGHVERQDQRAGLPFITQEFEVHLALLLRWKLRNIVAIFKFLFCFPVCEGIFSWNDVSCPWTGCSLGLISALCSCLLLPPPGRNMNSAFSVRCKVSCVLSPGEPSLSAVLSDTWACCTHKVSQPNSPRYWWWEWILGSSGKQMQKCYSSFEFLSDFLIKLRRKAQFVPTCLSHLSNISYS